MIRNGEIVAKSASSSQTCSGGVKKVVLFGLPICGKNVPVILLLAICVAAGFGLGVEAGFLTAVGLALLSVFSATCSTPARGTTAYSSVSQNAGGNCCSTNSGGASGCCSTKGANMKTLRDLPPPPPPAGG